MYQMELENQDQMFELMSDKTEVEIPNILHMKNILETSALPNEIHSNDI